MVFAKNFVLSSFLYPYASQNFSCRLDSLFFLNNSLCSLQLLLMNFPNLVISDVVQPLTLYRTRDPLASTEPTNSLSMVSEAKREPPMLISHNEVLVSQRSPSISEHFIRCSKNVLQYSLQLINTLGRRQVQMHSTQQLKKLMSPLRFRRIKQLESPQQCWLA